MYHSQSVRCQLPALSRPINKTEPLVTHADSHTSPDTHRMSHASPVNHRSWSCVSQFLPRTFNGQQRLSYGARLVLHRALLRCPRGDKVQCFI